MTSPEHPGSGHRARLLDRFCQGGLQSLSNYEIIELLLSCVISRKDLKPIAKALLTQYKTVSAVLSATQGELEKCAGIGPRAASLLVFIRESMAYCLAERVTENSVVTHRNDVEAYLKFHLGNRSDEFVAALFLDNANRIKKVAILEEGTVNQCAVFPRKVIEEALCYKASGFILAHNHPGGAKTASEADWQITRKLYAIGSLMDLRLLDHIIITRNETISLREDPRWGTLSVDI